MRTASKIYTEMYGRKPAIPVVAKMFNRLESEPFAEWTLLSFKVLFSREVSAYALYPWPKTGAVKNKSHAFPQV